MSQSGRRLLIRLAVVCGMCGLSAAQIYRLMAEGRFPGSVALGPNSRAWVEEEVATWIDGRIAARDSGADADLRIVNPNIGRGRQRNAGEQHVA